MTTDSKRGTFTYDYRNMPISMALSNAGGVTVNVQNQTLSGTYTNTSGDSVHVKDVTINSGSTVTIESRNAMRLEAGFNSGGATVSLKAGSASAGSGGASYTGTVYMTYDAGGQRVKYLKGSTSSPQDGSRIYVRGSSGNVLAEYVRSGNSWNLDHYNLYGNGLVGKLDGAGQKFFYIADHLGSIRVTLDQSGNIDSWTDYYPFGKESRGSSTSNRPREQFTGKERDSEIGLDYFGARYYNAEIGRWTSVDPLSGKYPSLTPYNYVLNSPANGFDPNGTYFVSTHYKITYDAMKQLGYTSGQSDWVSHYASVFADHPDEGGLAINNAVLDPDVSFRYNQVWYGATVNSQKDDPEFVKWHSMRSSFENISAEAAMARGMEFGWTKVFESASLGDIDNMGPNSAAIEAIGQGLHALQDAYAHRGASMMEHFLSRPDFILKDMMGSTGEASKITESALIVHQLLRGNFKALKDGLKLDLSGATKDQQSRIIKIMQDQGYVVEVK